MPAEKRMGRYWIPKCDVCGNAPFIHDCVKSKRICTKVIRDTYGWLTEKDYFVCPSCQRNGYVPVSSKSIRNACDGKCGSCQNCQRETIVMKRPVEMMQIRLGNIIHDLPKEVYEDIVSYMEFWKEEDIDQEVAEWYISDVLDKNGYEYDPGEVFDFFYDLLEVQ